MYVVGRAGRAGSIGSLTKVAGKGWKIFGAIGVLTAFFDSVLLLVCRWLVH